MNRLTQKKQKARNFARAFLRTHEITEEVLFSGVDVLIACCEQNSLVFHAIELSSAHIDDKYAAIDELVKRLGVALPLGKLLRAVLRYKEFDLLATILPMIKEEFKKMNRIHEVVIKTSHPIDEAQRQEVESLLYEKIPGTLRCMYQEDESLIAGIKIETPLYYWEHSVARTIRKLQQQLKAQEQS